MDKRKWKKLSKRFACALALAMLMSVNPAWAAVEEIDDNTLAITGTTVSDNSVGGYNISDYQNVSITNNLQRGVQIWDNVNIDWSNVDLTVNITGANIFNRNHDAIQINNGQFTLGNYTAVVSSYASDGLNLTHDSGSASSICILGDVDIDVKNGHGIRANSSIYTADTNIIDIYGTTHVKTSTGTLLGMRVGGVAVWAGSDTNGNNAKGKGVVNLHQKATIESSGTNSYGIWAGKNGEIGINDISITSTGRNSYGIAATNDNINDYSDSSANAHGSTVVMNGTENDINVSGTGGIALYADSQYGVIKYGENGIGYLNATGDITAEDSGTINLALKQYLSVTGDVSASDSAVIALTSMGSDATEKDFTVNGTVSAASKGSVTLASAGQNAVLAEAQTYDGAAGSVITGAQYGAGEAVAADAKSSSVMLSSGTSNYVGGGVSATNSGSVTLTGAADAEGVVTDGASNAVYSTHTRTSTPANGADEITFTNAVYAANGGSVEITAGKGGVNAVATYTPNAAQDAKERAVWASDGGSVSISGTTSITAGLHTLGSDNSAAIAIAAGTDDWADNADKDAEGNIVFDVADENRSNVTLEYGDGTGNLSSSITGDIVSGYAGSVSVMNASASDALSFTGNALAANGGELTLSLGNGSYWAGRADDYQDAASEIWRESHTDIFAPQFSNGIQAEGTVNVNLGSGSTWNVTGQSWVSRLDGDGTVILQGTDTGGYAVHIGEITGSNNFVVNLYTGENAAQGDMIYVANGTSVTQNVTIANRDEVLSSMEAGDRVRFATVGDAGYGFTEGGGISTASATFGRTARISDAGMLNVDFAVEYENYNDTANNDKHNDDAYNGEEMSAKKPGTDYVDDVYGNGENAQNVYLKRLASTDNPTDEPKLTGGGQTIVNMSRANYATAVYMDRLNKRLGEARYFAGEDEGIWARVRHDRVGRDDAYLVQNTMFEVGYDRKLSSKNGTRRVGIAADYMRGDTEYDNIAGEGEIDRFGLWLYSTWLGDKGHYTDYVLKWGRMSNEFDIYGMTTGERITGDYDNNVFSASAEYGRRIELGKGWFFEPQAQVQFAVITGADYVTSQGTQVDVDGINSLIGRAGFRLGKEFGGLNKGQFYIKADVLHEFLGDQDIHALDATTDGKWYYAGYENDGTWYDVGLGVSCKAGKNSYLFLDLEHSFGNDNDDSYQVSAGVQWSL